MPALEHKVIIRRPCRAYSSRRQAALPDPALAADRLRSASLLEYLAGRYDVDVIVFRQPGAPDPAGLIPHRLARSITVLDLPRHRRSLAARALRNAGRVVRRVPPLVDRFAGFSAAIAQAVGGGRLRHRRDRAFLVRAVPGADSAGLLADRARSAQCGKRAARPLRRYGRTRQRCCPSRLPTRFREAGARLAAALFAGARHVAGRCRGCPRDRTACHGRDLSERPAREGRCRAAGDEEAIVFSGNMEYHPELHRGALFPAGRSGRSCANAGRGWCGGWWGSNPAAVRRFTEGDPPNRSGRLRYPTQ